MDLWEVSFLQYFSGCLLLALTAQKMKQFYKYVSVQVNFTLEPLLSQWEYSVCNYLLSGDAQKELAPLSFQKDREAPNSWLLFIQEKPL